MSQSTPDKSTANDVRPSDVISADDIHRWRANVESFAQTTQTMLETIRNELSSGFASGRTEHVAGPLVSDTDQATPAVSMGFTIPTLNGPHRDTPTQHTKPNPSAADHAIEAIANVNTDECDALLARLKQQLADQLAD